MVPMDLHRASVLLEPQHALQNTNIYAAYGANPTDTAVTTEMMWWDAETIDAVVTRQFVLSKLRPNEQQRLDQPLGFGDGLTDDTYLEWIEEKAKRIFLILVDLNLTDRIFGIVDDSWDDDDLPMPLSQVERLRLMPARDERLERRFFQRQFTYLVRNLQKGDHLVYEDAEVIPLETVEKRLAPGKLHTSVDTVYLPSRPGDELIRRRIAIGLGPGEIAQEEFLSGVEALKELEHQHILSLWASYMHRGSGYVLLVPVNDSNLRSFLHITPQSIKIMAKHDRRPLLLNWLHCLANAVAFLHQKGVSHRKIKPSNILLDLDNNIFLSDTGFSNAYEDAKKSIDQESFDYASPEQWERPPYSPSLVSSAVNRFSRSGGGKGAVASRMSVASSSSSSSAYTTSTASSSSSYASMMIDVIPGVGRNTDPQKQDVFALACVFLDILTVLMKRSPRNFAAHRSAKQKSLSRGAPVDSSFHSNLDQVESWMNTLAKDASKKEDRIFRGISHLISICSQMLHPEPNERPTAQYVADRIHDILTKFSWIKEPHCGPHRSGETNWEFKFGQLQIDRAAAARADTASVMTKTSQSSDSKSKNGSSSRENGLQKAKGKAKAWKAPVYAGMCLCAYISGIRYGTDAGCRAQFWMRHAPWLLCRHRDVMDVEETTMRNGSSNPDRKRLKDGPQHTDTTRPCGTIRHNAA